MELHINTINSHLITDNPKLISALRDLYAFKVPGAEYSPQYRNKVWDGKKRFFSQKGEFKTGLLERVLLDLKKAEADVKIIDNRIINENTKEYTFKDISYYDYQAQTIDKALKKKRSVIKSPTGSGKTLIMAGLVKALEGRKMLLLFNAKLLLTQTYEFLKSLGIPNLGMCFSEGFIQGDVMLCTVQSIEKILDTHLDTEVLMVDECHEFANGRTTVAAIQSFPQAVYRYGFTATPPSQKISLFNLEGGIGPVHSVASTEELVEDGKLTKALIQIIQRKDQSKPEDNTLSYLEIYDKFIVHNATRNEKIKDIVDEIKNKNKRARILILTKALDHGRTLENLLGGQCEFLEGADTIQERYKAISRFRGCRKSSVLIGTKILQTGVNIEEVTHLINARGMKSEIATLQALGRALRKHETKEVVYIYDFLDTEKYLLEHSLERINHYTKEKHKVIKI
jgi:superfamily II DNA or RNA helicase